MFPVLFTLRLGSAGAFTVGTYGLFYAVGFLLALRLAVAYARREGIASARIVDLGIVTLLAGFIGAKLTLYLLEPSIYLAHPMEMIRSLRSAGVFYGGFVLAAAAGLVYVRRHGLPLGRVADVVTPAVALGQGIGRIGCFMAGCCYGKACALPWAVTFTDPEAYRLTGVTLGVALHPTQLYHAAADFLVWGVAALQMRRPRAPGTVFWTYILLHAVLRFAIEFARGDVARGVFFGGHLSTSQIVAVPAALAAIVMLARLRRRAVPGAPAGGRD